MYALGYSAGSMFTSSLSGSPQLGRTSVCVVVLAAFVVLQVPTVLCQDLGASLPLYPIAGFFSSAALAMCDACIAYAWVPEDHATGMGVWALALIGGNVPGPIIGTSRLCTDTIQRALTALRCDHLTCVAQWRHARAPTHVLA